MRWEVAGPLHGAVGSAGGQAHHGSARRKATPLGISGEVWQVMGDHLPAQRVSKMRSAWFPWVRIVLHPQSPFTSFKGRADMTLEKVPSNPAPEPLSQVL